MLADIKNHSLITSFLTFITIFCILFSDETLSTDRFQLIIDRTYSKYESQKIQTSWHRELYQNYLQCITTQKSDKFSAFELVKLGLKQEFIDQMIIEYVKEKSSSFIIVLFSPLSDEKEKALLWLSKYGDIVYYKTIKLQGRGIKNLLRGIYDVHHCDGWQKTYEGIDARFQHLLTLNEYHNICVVVWEGPSLQKAIECKRMIRSEYDNDNRVVHFTDRHHEAVHCAELLFNQNSIAFLEHVDPKNFGPFVTYAKELQQFLKEHPDFHDSYCVDTGGVLSAFGLRPCGDFDLLLDEKFELPFIRWGLNNTTRKKYGYNIYDIVYNPRQHFYYKGIRFVSLENVLEFKLKKYNKKDQQDIILIQDFYLKHSSF